MLDFIIHLFAIVPLFVSIKNMHKPQTIRFMTAAVLFLLTLVLHFSLFLKSKALSSYPRSAKNQNLYEFMEVSPKGYERRELKKRYQELSKQYHPDKNPSEDAANQFMKVKLGK